MSALNPEQAIAANFTHGVCSVIAVPGSGKTLTMTHRIANLIRQHGVNPKSILGVTFTNNAAQAMKERLKDILGKQADEVFLKTLHGFCFHLLKQQGLNFSLLNDKEQVWLIKAVLRNLGLRELPAGLVIREISLARNNLLDLEQFSQLHGLDPIMSQVALAWEEYEARKQAKLKLDFDDLLVRVNQLLTDDEQLTQSLRARFPHVMVDEFQDTNPLQFEILRQMVGPVEGESSFFVVGDDWQSIYAFTGASVGSILDFSQNFPGCTQFMLSSNYRSTPQILAACRNLIRNNQRQISKTLITDNPPGAPVKVIESSSEETEAQAIADEIEDLVHRQGYAYADIAVLYRANFQSRTMEEAFSQRKLPYRIQNGQCFYQRHEVRVLLDYLRVIDDPHGPEGEESLLRIINFPNRYLSKGFVDNLKDLARRQGIGLYEALGQINPGKRYLKDNLDAFREIIEQCRYKIGWSTAAEMIELLRKSLDYDRHITDQDIPSPDNPLIQNIDQLQMSASRFEDVTSFLAFADSFNEAEVHDVEGVQLMTIHKAKGLEFPVVLLPGLVEGITPTKRGDIEEERRIVFVGISRARQRLYLSHSRTYLGQPVKKSIFIDEIMAEGPNA